MPKIKNFDELFKCARLVKFQILLYCKIDSCKKHQIPLTVLASEKKTGK